jgi:hypothetical protein
MKTIALCVVSSILLLCSNSASAATLGDRADTVAGVVSLTKTLMVSPPRAPIIIVRKLVVTIIKVLL